MSARIFFSDLDGTLLTGDKKISPRTRRALERFIGDGNYFAVSTGRAMESALAVQRELELYYPRTFLIACNGAEIYSCDEKREVFRAGIDLELVGRIMELAKERHVHVHTYNDTHIVSPVVDDPGDEECLTFYRRVIKTPLLMAEDVVAHLDKPPGKCIGIELHDLDKLERFRQEVAAMGGDRITTLYSYPQYLEIFNAEAGKGSAVDRLSQYLEVPRVNTIGAGDEENDISMIRAAGLGIAMKNGNPLAQAAADAVTETDNDHDGLAPFLEAAVSDPD